MVVRPERAAMHKNILDSGYFKFNQRLLQDLIYEAVGLFDVDHGGLVLFDADRKWGYVVVEYPDLGIAGERIPIGGVAAQEKLIAQRKPQVVSDAQSNDEVGSARAILAKFKIKALVLVPLIIRGEVIGSFGLDSIERPCNISETDLEKCESVAKLFAAVLGRDSLVSDLLSVREQALSSGTLDEIDKFLEMNLTAAVRLLKAHGGELFQYDERTSKLIRVASINQPEGMKSELEPGQGMAGHILQSSLPSMIVNDYNNSIYRVEAFEGETTSINAVLGVPLWWEDEITGVLLVDGTSGHKFDEKDAFLLNLFAGHAAIALTNAHMLRRDAEKLKKLESLTGATNKILSAETAEQKFRLIVEYTKHLLHAESSALFLVKRPGWLNLEASSGAREGFEIDRELRIESGPRTGLTGHIAHHRRVFREHGVRLRQHFAVTFPQSEHDESGECESLIAVSLLQRRGAEEELVGLLRANNKTTADGQLDISKGFDELDELLIRHLAKVVVSVIGDTLAENHLRELGTLMSHSPAAMIAVDKAGRVTHVNERACEVLDYEHENDLVGQDVRRFYANPDTAQKVRKALEESRDGRIAGFRTEARSKPQSGQDEGRIIPILLTSTWLYDDHGERIGSIGVFEDLGAIMYDYEQVKREAAVLADLYNASTEITSSLSAELKNTLDKIAEQALLIIGERALEGDCFSHVSLLNGSELIYISAYPPDVLPALKRLKRIMVGDRILGDDPYVAEKHGIDGRVARTGISEIVNDVSQDKDYNLVRPDIRSQLSVPIWNKTTETEEVIGVIGIEHRKFGVFTEQDKRKVERLAPQASAAILVGKHNDEVKRMQHELAAQTALAWAGAKSGVLLHRIGIITATIKGLVHLIRGDIQRKEPDEKVLLRLEEIIKLTEDIPTPDGHIPSLSPSEDVDSLYVNKTIREFMVRLSQKWSPEEKVELELDGLELDESISVRASIRWLREAFEILADNSIKAMQNQPVKRITITTRRSDDGREAEITFSDTGSGIPERLRDQIFVTPIYKDSEREHKSMGLIIAKLIITTYGGRIQLGKSNTLGTTILIRLPVEW